MRRIAWMGVLACLAGCGELSDPGTSVLVPGSEVIVYRDPELPGQYDSDDTTEARIEVGKGKGIGGFSFIRVKVGTKARVIKDPRESPDDQKQVVIRISEGASVDQVGGIDRERLRPIPAR